METSDRQGFKLKLFIDDYIDKCKKDGKRVTQADIAAKIGVTRQGLTTYFKSEYLNPDTLDKIEDALGLTRGYILSKEWMPITTFAKPGEAGTPLYNFAASANNLTVLFNDNAHVLDYIKIPGAAKLDGAIFVTGDSMAPLLKSGDVIAYKQVHIDDIFPGQMYILSHKLSDGEIITSIKYIKKSERGPEWVKLVSENPEHAPKDIQVKNIVALAHVRASVRVNF